MSEYLSKRGVQKGVGNFEYKFQGERTVAE